MCLASFRRLKSFISNPFYAMRALFIILFVILLQSASSCDENLLKLLKPSIKCSEKTIKLLDLAGHAINLAGALQTIDSARPASQALFDAWSQFISRANTYNTLKDTDKIASLASIIDMLRSNIEKENLLGAHEFVKIFFYSTLGCIPKNELTTLQTNILETTLSLQDIQSLASSRDFEHLDAALKHFLPKVESLASSIDQSARFEAENFLNLCHRIISNSSNKHHFDDNILVGVSLIKNEFASLLRTLASNIANLPHKDLE